MIKRISVLVVTLLAAAFITGCKSSEPEPNIPVGKPGDGGPQPTKVQAAGGGGQSGTTQTPSTE